MVKRFTKWVKDTKAIKLLFIEIALISLLGFANTIINHDQLAEKMAEIINNDGLVYVVSTIAVIFNAIILQCSTVLAISIVAYFVSAAMGKGTNIKRFGGLAIRTTFFTFTMTLIDLIGFLTIKKKLISFGVVGVLGYLPFYLSVFLLMYKLADTKMEFSQKQKMVLSAICSISSVLITYPF